MTALSAEFVEREYNLRAAFPDHPEWFARWAADSAAARRKLNGALDLRYGSGPKQTLDLFPAARPHAALMFIHGGYWRALDKQDHSFVAPPLVERGIGVAVVNYDLCPDVSIARIAEQCREAALWLMREGARYDVPAKRLVVAGHSAGGHLAACMLATDWKALAPDAPADLVPAAYSISGVFDLEPLVQVSMNSDLRLDAAEARRVSPIHWPLAHPCEFDAVVGGLESSEFLRQSRMIVDAWSGQATTRYEEIPGTNHFTILDALPRADSAMVERLAVLCKHAQAR